MVFGSQCSSSSRRNHECFSGSLNLGPLYVVDQFQIFVALLIAWQKSSEHMQAYSEASIVSVFLPASRALWSVPLSTSRRASKFVQSPDPLNVLPKSGHSFEWHAAISKTARGPQDLFGKISNFLNVTVKGFGVWVVSGSCQEWQNSSFRFKMKIPVPRSFCTDKLTQSAEHVIVFEPQWGSPWTCQVVEKLVKIW